MRRNRAYSVDWSNLRELYWEEDLSHAEIAELKGCTYQSVVSAMRTRSIPSRSISEAIKLGIRQDKRKPPILYGEDNPMFGRQFSEEWKKEQSQRIIKYYEDHPEAREAASKMFSGAGNGNWQGGVSNEPYPFEFNEGFKEAIRERDNRTCQLCSLSEERSLQLYGARLDVHHITCDKSDLDPDHFTALCKVCHGRQKNGR